MDTAIILTLIFGIGVLASFIGVMVGGGGLISIPFLMFAGLPPQIAVATNRMGSVGLSLGGAYKYWKGKKIITKYVLPFVILGIIGSFIGANILVKTDNVLLSKIIGIVLVISAGIVFIKKDFGTIHKKKISKQREWLGYFIYLLLAVWSGFFSGGAGILVNYLLIGVFGLTLIESSATDMIPWFFLSLTALIVFAINGKINYLYGIFLFAGMLVGSYLGAHFAVKKGERWVRVLFIILVLGLGIKLLFF